MVTSAQVLCQRRPDKFGEEGVCNVIRIHGCKSRLESASPRNVQQNIILRVFRQPHCCQILLFRKRDFVYKLLIINSFYFHVHTIHLGIGLVLAYTKRLATL